MAKSSKKQIDQDEKRVIEQLQRNSNESIDKIAKTCGFSRQKVWRIIKRLENNKTIWGYTAIPDKEKQGVHHYIMLIKRSNEPAADIIDGVI
ncbi:MAG: transcriptional regulator, partial [Thermoplasmata archaeon M11B2D]